MSPPFLSVVIPAYNEEGRIALTLEAVVRYTQGQGYTWEVIVADDGSLDETASLVEAAARENPGIRLLRLNHGGKGWAVKSGMLEARGQYRFLADADLSMPIEHLERFLPPHLTDFDIAIGSREAPGARRFHEPMRRHLLGRVFNGMVRMLAVRGISDTQCGFKGFTAQAAETLFPLQRSHGFGFDVEVLFLARKLGMRVVEVPIDWHYHGGSKVRPWRDGLLMSRDLLSVRWNDLRGRYSAVRAGGAHPTPPPTLERARTPITPRDELKGPLPLAAGREMKVVVVVPTYNEARNIPELASRLFSLDLPSLHLLVVDDGSPDGTGRIAEGLAEAYPGRVQVLHRQGKQGLGTAYVEGFRHALNWGADVVVEMDADLSHNPQYLPLLLDKMADYDVAVASRYVPGGEADPGWGLGRRLLSRGGNLYAHLAAGLRVKDATAGFKALRRGVVESIDMGSFRCKGFAFQIEMAYACQRKGFRVAEVPISFVDRGRGTSKLSLAIVLEALWHVLWMRWRRF
ncbi:MAG: hypothetical protein HW388_318 [Dehalococcoidia bacterium]|nr:hypothetical protein [Dehalococcoidia bacterium]